MSSSVSGNEFGGDELPAENLARFQSVLRRFKSEGCNLLVAGDVPREVFTRASESMLGDPDARRWRVFALTDAPSESAYDRLPAASERPRSPAETTTIVNRTPPPPATDCDRASVSVSSIPEVTVPDADLDGFRRELVDAVREFREQSFRPAEVRVAVDSLAPLLDDHAFGAVRRFLRGVRECVYDCDAMAHYLLPEPYGGDRCQRLAGEFDAVVELRTAPAESDGPVESDGPASSTADSASDAATRSCAAEERWHLPESGATMPWVPV